MGDDAREGLCDIFHVHQVERYGRDLEGGAAAVRCSLKQVNELRRGTAIPETSAEDHRQAQAGDGHAFNIPIESRDVLC